MEYENRPSEVEDENRPISSLIDQLTQAYPLRRLSTEWRENEVIRVSGPGALTLCRQLLALSHALGVRIELKDQRGLLGKKDEVAKVLLPRPEMKNGKQATDRQQWLDHASAPQFDAHRQSGVAGLWLAESGKKESELIGRQLSFGDLAFSTTAYLEYRDKVQLTQKLYDKVGYLAPAFQELNAGIFRHQSLEDAQAFVARQLHAFIQSANQLHFNYARAINHHFRIRKTWYQQRYLLLTTALRDLESQQAIWLLTSTAKSRKERKAAEQKVTTAWNALQFAHEKADRPPFEFNWPEPEKRSGPQEQRKLSAAYQQLLKDWNDKQRAQIREEQLGLNATTDPERGEEWNALYEQMTELLESVNNSGLFQRPLAAAVTTVPRQQKLVEQLLEKLHLLQRLLPDLPAFYRWQHHWFSLEAELRRVISPLLVTPRSNWMTAFSAWYFENGVADHLFGAQRAAYLPLEWTKARGKTVQENEQDAFRFTISTDPEPAENSQLSEWPSLLLCEPTRFPSEREPVHYLSRYGHYLPGLAFVQEWTSHDLPDWKQSVPASAPEVMKMVRKTLPQDEYSSLIFLARSTPEAPLEIVSPENMMGGEWAELLLYAAGLPADPEGGISRKLGVILPYLWGNIKKIRLVLDATPDQLTNALLSDGFSGAFALAATVRGCEAIAENDRNGFEAMAREVRKRLGAPLSRPDPMIREILPVLSRSLPRAHLQPHLGWRDIFLPLMIQMPNGRKSVLLPDDLVPGADTLVLDDERRRELGAAGFTLLPIFTSELMTDVEATIKRLVAGLLEA